MSERRIDHYEVVMDGGRFTVVSVGSDGDHFLIFEYEDEESARAHLARLTTESVSDSLDGPSLDGN